MRKLSKFKIILSTVKSNFANCIFKVFNFGESTIFERLKEQSIHFQMIFLEKTKMKH